MMGLHRPGSARERGIGAILAIMLLVIMASLAAALLTIGTSQQATSAADVQSARAFAAARIGTEIGLFKAISSTTPGDSWKTCSGLSLSLDLSASTGFHVTVTCASNLYYEGDCDVSDTDPHCVVNPNDATKKVRSVRLYRIEATACNSSVACPDSALSSSAGYIERVRQVIASN
jgi:MSHA biogenesis protein MshP